MNGLALLQTLLALTQRSRTHCEDEGGRGRGRHGLFPYKAMACKLTAVWLRLQTRPFLQRCPSPSSSHLPQRRRRPHNSPSNLRCYFSLSPSAKLAWTLLLPLSVSCNFHQITRSNDRCSCTHPRHPRPLAFVPLAGSLSE